MSSKSQRRRKLKENLFNKRRLIILNEDTFEETFSLKLTLMNVFLVASVEQFNFFVTTFIIAFTPLREFIPIFFLLKKDALEFEIRFFVASVEKNEVYIKSIQKY
jgi:uncharacterized protein (UPF0262 family)